MWESGVSLHDKPREGGGMFRIESGTAPVTVARLVGTRTETFLHCGRCLCTLGGLHTPSVANHPRLVSDEGSNLELVRTLFAPAGGSPVFLA